MRRGGGGLGERVASRWVVPSVLLRMMWFWVSGSQRARVTAMRWIAALIWRLPPRSRRCRAVRPEFAGMGARAAALASLASDVEPSAPAISPTSLAAVNRAAAGLGDELRGDLGHQHGDF